MTHPRQPPAEFRFTSSPGTPATSTFDPNEDPVVIGGGASIDDGVSGTATPDHPNVGGYTGTTVVGPGAFSDGKGAASAFGHNAGAFGTSSLAAADNAGADADDAVAMGHNSQAAGVGDTAVGPAAVASGGGSGSEGAAFGAGATAAGEFTTAIGPGSRANGQPSSGSSAFGAGAAALNPEGGLAAGAFATIAAGSDRCTACGSAAAATGLDSALLGNGASDGGFTNVVALGSATAATVDNQTALGNLTTPTFAETVQGLVVIDSVLNTRVMITVANNVLTLTAAP